MGALTAMIEMEQRAFLGDLQCVAAMLQPNAPAKISGGVAAADADGDTDSSVGGDGDGSAASGDSDD